jgi:hypothetical protein
MMNRELNIGRERIAMAVQLHSIVCWVVQAAHVIATLRIVPG